MLFILFCSTSYCAQNALITSDGSAIREAPNSSSPIIETRKQGEKVRVSEKDKNGWHKVRLKSKKGFGWISKDNLHPTSQDQYLDMFKREHTPVIRHDYSKGPLFSFRTGGLGFAFIPQTINEVLQLSNNDISIALGGYVDLGIRVGYRKRIAARVMTYTSSYTVKSQGVDYEIVHSGLPILLGLESDVVSEETWLFSYALYLGMSPANKFSATAYEMPGPNSYSITDNRSWAAFLNFSYRWMFSKYIGLAVEAGLFYSYGKKQSQGSNFNGSAAFYNSQTNTMKQLSLSHVGVIGSLGLQFAVY